MGATNNFFHICPCGNMVGNIKEETGFQRKTGLLVFWGGKDYMFNHKKETAMVEVYILTGFLLFYLLTVWLLRPKVKRKLWMIAFMISFAITSIAISLIHGGQQDVMLTANQFNWYYFIYLFGMISIALALFNVWIYRHALWELLFDTSEEDDDDNSL